MAWCHLAFSRQKPEGLEQRCDDQEKPVLSQNLSWTTSSPCSKSEYSGKQMWQRCISLVLGLFFFTSTFSKNWLRTSQVPISLPENYLLLLGWSGPTSCPCSSRNLSGLKLHGLSQNSELWFIPHMLHQIWKQNPNDGRYICCAIVCVCSCTTNSWAFLLWQQGWQTSVVFTLGDSTPEGWLTRRNDIFSFLVGVMITCSWMTQTKNWKKWFSCLSVLGYEVSSKFAIFSRQMGQQERNKWHIPKHFPYNLQKWTHQMILVWTCMPQFKQLFSIHLQRHGTWFAPRKHIQRSQSASSPCLWVWVLPPQSSHRSPAASGSGDQGHLPRERSGLELWNLLLLSLNSEKKKEQALQTTKGG